ncbi:MAG: CRTAC1 family protein [Acidobacteria bacterium]|nr:CRTAC1 family protein [Acidobacteriota bacterium]
MSPSARGKFSGRPWDATFTDVSQRAGLTHPTVYGGVDRIDYLVESSGGGLAVIDFDRDGWQDLFVVNGTRFHEAAGSHHLLYRNNHDGTFTEVSERAGVAKSGWGMAVAVGDYDGDGWDDLFVTQWGHDILFRNNGNGTFSDVTAKAGLARAEVRWGAGATFVDYDRDGRPDLFVSTYLDFDPAKTPKPGGNPNCTWKGMNVACGPRGLAPGRHYLFHNERGKFVDVTRESGVLAASPVFGMTVVAADFDDDGWPDLYAASDSTPSHYFRNLHNGKFQEEGLERGVAVNEDGREQAGMGVAVADVNNDGRLDIFKTHFSEDTPVLYINEGRGSFRDATLTAGLGVETRYVGWGASLADFDNDGWADLFWVSGHLYPETKLADFPYRTPALLFRNLGAAKFEQLPPDLAGAAIAEPHSSRGSVVFDYDHDGDLDIAIWNRNEPVRLLRNGAAKPAQWIQFEAPLHTRVTLLRADGRRQAQEVVSQSSFYSAPGRVLHFGLRAATKADVEVQFPGQPPRTYRGLAAGQRHSLIQSK